MARLEERDAMICRTCAQEERASEGYPCADCGTFICLICTMRGAIRCRRCGARHPDGDGRVARGVGTGAR